MTKQYKIMYRDDVLNISSAAVDTVIEELRSKGHKMTITQEDTLMDIVDGFIGEMFDNPDYRNYN